MHTIILSSGARASVRPAPYRVAADVARRLGAAPERQADYVRWAEQILRAVERYIEVPIDAATVAEARRHFTAWAEHGATAPRSDKVCYLLWCAITDPDRADLVRLVEPIVAPTLASSLQRRARQRQGRR